MPLCRHSKKDVCKLNQKIRRGFMKLFKKKKKVVLYDENDIKKMESFNSELIKNFARLGEERLQDALDTKRGHAIGGIVLLFFNLFLLFIFKNNLCCVLSCLGFILSLGAIYPMSYGSMGCKPSSFLEKDHGYNYLTTPKKYEPVIYIYMMLDTEKNIKISVSSNRIKLYFLYALIYSTFANIVANVVMELMKK